MLITWDEFSTAQWGAFLADDWATFVFGEGAPIEPAFRYLLLNDPDVAAIVSDRVYLVNRPQDQRNACIVINLIDEFDAHTLTDHAGYFTGRMQVDCLAATAKDAALLAIAARWALDSATGVIAGCNVDWIKASGRRRLPMEQLDGQAVPTYGMSLDCTFMYEI